MPRIQRSALPKQLLAHLYDQALARKLSLDDLIALRRWLDSSPEVPDGPMVQAISGVYCLWRGWLAQDISAASNASVG